MQRIVRVILFSVVGVTFIQAEVVAKQVVAPVQAPIAKPVVPAVPVAAAPVAAPVAVPAAVAAKSAAKSVVKAAEKLAAPAKTPTSFPICTSYPAFGEMDVIGKQLIDGVTMSLNSMNKNKKSIALAHVGNNDRTGTAGLKNMQNFMAKTHVVLGGIGTTFWLQFFAQPWSKNAIQLFPMCEDHHLRTLGYERTIFYRPTPEQELQALGKHVIKELIKDKIGILYESGFAGKAQFDLLTKTLKELGVEPVVSARYTQNTVEIDRALKSIVDAAPNAIFCLAKPRPAYKFIKQAVDLGQTSMLFVGMSPLISIQQLVKKARGIDILTISLFPPESSSAELPTLFKKSAGAYFRANRKVDFPMEVFFYMHLLSWALEKKPEITLRPELLLPFFEQIKNEQVAGMPLSFDPSTRSLAKKLWLVPKSDAEDSWIEVDYRKS